MMKTRRMDESRARLARAFAFALGGYMEQEATKEDQWRDQSIGQLYAHLRHEIDEIQANLRQSDLTWLVHNASDVCGLATIFLATVLEMAKVEKKDESASERRDPRGYLIHRHYNPGMDHSHPDGEELHDHNWRAHDVRNWVVR